MSDHSRAQRLHAASPEHRRQTASFLARNYFTHLAWEAPPILYDAGAIRSRKAYLALRKQIQRADDPRSLAVLLADLSGDQVLGPTVLSAIRADYSAWLSRHVLRQPWLAEHLPPDSGETLHDLLLPLLDLAKKDRTVAAGPNTGNLEADVLIVELERRAYLQRYGGTYRMQHGKLGVVAITLQQSGVHRDLAVLAHLRRRNNDNQWVAPEPDWMSKRVNEASHDQSDEAHAVRAAALSAAR